MSVKQLNPNAEVMGKSAALFMNINAAKGLYDVMKSNLGPKGTIKMLVGGSGDIKLTKDGNVLLREMQIQNPTAVMIARTAVAQDDVTGDGTCTTVMVIGEIMKQAERYIQEGLHPRVLCEGLDAAKEASVQFLDRFYQKINTTDDVDYEIIRCVAESALRTKLYQDLADQLVDITVNAIKCIRTPGQPIDLHMVETLHMRHKMDSDTKLIEGLVLDHGARHPDMPKYLENCYILTCNISLEYEKSEVNSGFFYSSAEERERLVAAERDFTDERTRQVIALKKKVCDGTNNTFVVINQKGIDPIALDMLAKEGILGLRRAKKRNMERLMLACGGVAVNSELELAPEVLGWAGKVHEHVLGEEKYTFVEKPKNPSSCTILIKGPNDHTIAQIKDAVRDGLRAVKNAYEDGCVVMGAGVFEVALERHLVNETMKTVQGRAKLGVAAFAESLLCIPKTLAENSGYDAQDSIIAMQEEHDKGHVVGFDIATGDPISPSIAGVYDTYLCKKQVLNSAPIIATQLLLVDEVMRAGRNMRK